MTRSSIQAGKAVILVDILDKASGGFKGIIQKIQGLSKGLSNLGTNAAGGSLLTGLGVKSIISNFIDFEDKILNLSAKLGYFGILTKQQDMTIKDLSNTIIDLGKATSYTSSEVADAAIALAQAGFNAGEIKGSLKGVLDLARGTGYSLGEAGDLLANTIRTFNLFGADDTFEQRMQKVNYVSSMFVKATRLGTIEIQDLRESLKYAGGTADNLGASLSTVLGLLVQASEGGLKASLAGTSMGTAFLNLVQNLDKLQKRLPGFQLFMDQSGRVDFSKTFASLTKLTNKMDRVEKTKLFQDIFNIRGGRFISTIKDMEKVDAYINSIAQAGNEAALASAKMESGLGGALRRATSAVEALNIAVGYTFNENGKAILNFTTVAIESIERVVQKHKAFIALLILSPGILAATAVGAIGLSFALNRVVQILRIATPLIGGVKFLKNSLVNSGKLGIGAISSSAKANAGRALAYKKSQERLAKANLAVDVAIAKAMAKRTAAAQATALAKVYSGNKMKNSISAALGMQKARTTMQTGSIFGQLGLLGSAVKAGSIAKTATSIAMLAGSIFKMTFGLARFALSWNAVGLAINLLLIFGDKIPPIAKAFKSLGEGFGAAFEEIGKIGQYIGPSISLFQLAMEAFSKGDTNVGLEALRLSFEGIVSIVQNQLTAAWERFLSKTQQIWVFVEQVGLSIYSVFDSIVTSLGEIIGNTFDGISKKTQGLFGDSTSNPFMTALLNTTILFNRFVFTFAEAVIQLQDWGGEFLDRLTGIASGKTTMQAAMGVNPVSGMRHLIDMIPKSSILGEVLSGTGLSKLGYGTKAKPDNPRVAKLENDRIKSEVKLKEVFAKIADDLKEANIRRATAANTDSIFTKFDSQAAFNRLTEILAANQAKLKAEQDALAATQGTLSNGISTPRNELMAETRELFSYALTNLVTSIQSGQNQFLKDKGDKQLDEQKKTNELLQDINRTLITTGTF